MAIIESENYRKQYNLTRRLKRKQEREDEAAREDRRNGWTLDNPALLVTLPKTQGLIPQDVLLELSPQEMAIYAIRHRLAVPKANFNAVPDAVLTDVEPEHFDTHA